MSFEKRIVFENLKKNFGNVGNDYISTYAIDTKLLLEFLNDTQPKVIKRLLVECNQNDLFYLIYQAISKEGIIKALIKGIKIQPAGCKEEQLFLYYTKPNNTINPEEMDRYNKNRFFVVKELNHNGTAERIDISIGVNGLHLFAVELKNGTTQTYLDAEEQLKNERDHSSPYFKHIICSFAMDRLNITMCANLSKDSEFLPFNKGNNGGAGNPDTEYPHYPVEYFWEEVMTKEGISNLIQNFIFFSDDFMIFPRYHQFKCTNNILEDIEKRYKENDLKNYLVAAAAGSGKTFMIVWTAYKLAYLNDKDNKHVFDSVIIVSNRLVINKQLDQAMNKIDHQTGFVIKPATAEKLKKAINDGDRIIVANMQKFPDAVDGISATKNKRFAVLIDEGHDSTSGSYMNDIKTSFSVGEKISLDDYLKNHDFTSEQIADLINDRKEKIEGKLDNVSFIAFTATPKKETREIFGDVVCDEDGNPILDDENRKEYKPFFSYTMKQAIEEGFILDVLKNYNTYSLFCKAQCVKEEDLIVDVDKTNKTLTEATLLDDAIIEKKVNIFMGFFLSRVNDMDGNTKAMIVTGRREAALKYYIAINKYFADNGLSHKALIAYSDCLEIKGKKYFENDFNKLTKPLEEVFHKNKEYKFLIVADKYTTGFDEPYLSMMLVDCGLKSVKAVQTLSRLNRVCKEYPDKRTFVLDYVNDYDDILESFKTFYVDAKYYRKDDYDDIYKLVMNVDDLGLATDEEIHNCAVYLESAEYKKDDSAYLALTQIIARIRIKFEDDAKAFSKDEFEQLKYKKEKLWIIRNFVRMYDICVQKTIISDRLLRDKDVFYSYLLACIKLRTNVLKVKDLSELVRFTNICITKGETIDNPDYGDGKELSGSSGANRKPSKKKPETDTLEEAVKVFNENLGLSPAEPIFKEFMAFLLSNSFCINVLCYSKTFDEFEKIIYMNCMDAKCNVYKVLTNNPSVYNAITKIADFDFRNDCLHFVLLEIWKEKKIKA